MDTVSFWALHSSETGSHGYILISVWRDLHRYIPIHWDRLVNMITFECIKNAIVCILKYPGIISKLRVAVWTTPFITWSKLSTIFCNYLLNIFKSLKAIMKVCVWTSIRNSDSLKTEYQKNEEVYKRCHLS